MTGLVLHPKTEAQLEALIANPTHAVAIIGPAGSGKRTLSELLAARIMGLEPTQLFKQPYVLKIEPNPQTIAIEQVRELRHFVHLKTIGTGTIRRIVIVLDAGRMTSEAQNAVLKLLEEPPADTMLILTVDNEQSLLPTIVSRLQKLVVWQPAEQAVRNHFGGQFDAATVERAYFLSGGLPGLMLAILEHEQAHPLVAAVLQAKDILQKSTFERLIIADTLSKKKDELRYVLEALRRIAETGQRQAARQEDNAKVRRWHAIIAATYQAENELARSANAKLVLTNLMLAL